MNRSHIDFHLAFPGIFRSKREMWSLALLSLPFGYFRSHKLLNIDKERLAAILKDHRVYLISKNPPSFTRWRVKMLKDLTSVNVGDRYIACGPILSKGPSKTEIMKRIADERGVELKDCLLIDDSLENVQEASAAGLVVRVVRRPWNVSNNQFSAMEPAQIPNDAEEFLDSPLETEKDIYYVIPRRSIFNTIKFASYLWRQWWLFSQGIPKRQSVVPLVNDNWSAVFRTDPNRGIIEKLENWMKVGVLPYQIKLITLKKGSPNIRVDLHLPFQNFEERTIKKLREYSRKVFESFGHHFKKGALFHFRSFSDSSEEVRLLNSESVRLAMKEHSISHTLEAAVVQKLAVQYIRSLIPHRTYGGCLFADWLMTYVMSKIFRKVEVSYNKKIEEIEFDYFLVFSSIHRSYLDSGIVCKIISDYTHNFPYVVSADKMKRVWIGKLGSLVGAMFIKRKFVDNLYAAILTEHINGRQHESNLLELFLEGQRSRSGLTLPPKRGVANVIWNNMKNKDASKVAIIPMSIVYNKIPESEFLLKERFEERDWEGNLSLREKADMFVKRKRKKTFLQKLKSLQRKLTSIPVSECYINFGDPIVLHPEHLGKADSQVALRSYLDQTMRSINSVTPALSSSILCLSILGSKEGHLARGSAVTFLKMSYDLLRLYSSERTEALKSEEEIENEVDQVLSLPFVNRKFKRFGLVNRGILVISDLDIERATYYKNNILHFFVLPNILAYILTYSKSGRIEELHRFLDQVFGKLSEKYFLPLSVKPRLFLDKALEVFAVHELISVNKQFYFVQEESAHSEILGILSRLGEELADLELASTFDMLRRDYPRTDLSIKTTFSQVTHKSVDPAKVMNVSETGFYVKTLESFDIHDKVELRAVGHSDVSYEGEVVRIDFGGAGVKSFRKIDLPTKTAFSAHAPHLLNRRSVARTEIEAVFEMTIIRKLDAVGEAKNLSLGGAFIHSTESFSKGDVLQFLFEHGPSQIEMSAVVCRKEPDGIGIKFESRSVDKEVEINLFVSNLVQVRPKEIIKAALLKGTST